MPAATTKIRMLIDQFAVFRVHGSPARRLTIVAKWTTRYLYLCTSYHWGILTAQNYLALLSLNATNAIHKTLTLKRAKIIRPTIQKKLVLVTTKRQGHLFYAHRVLLTRKYSLNTRILHQYSEIFQLGSNHIFKSGITRASRGSNTRSC